MRKNVGRKGRRQVRWEKRGQTLCAAVLCILFSGVGVFCVAERVSGAEESAVMAAAGVFLPGGGGGGPQGGGFPPRRGAGASSPF